MTVWTKDVTDLVEGALLAGYAKPWVKGDTRIDLTTGAQSYWDGTQWGAPLNLNGYLWKSDGSGLPTLVTPTGAVVIKVNNTSGDLVLGVTGLTVNVNPALVLKAAISNYNNLVTAGQGVPPIYAATSQKNESATDATALSYTPPAQVGVYRVRGILDVSASSTGVVAISLTWKDANGTTHTATAITLYKKGVVAGSLGPTVAAGDTWDFDETISIDASATAVVVGFTLTSGTVTLKLSATVERLV